MVGLIGVLDCGVVRRRGGRVVMLMMRMMEVETMRRRKMKLIKIAAVLHVVNLSVPREDAVHVMYSAGGLPGNHQQYPVNQV